MKNAIITLLGLFLSVGVFAQSTDYIQMEGNIGDNAATMSLFRVKYPYESTTVYSAYYYYHSTGIPMELTQSESKGIQLKMTYAVTNQEEETFDGTLSNGVYKGNWTKSGTTLPFEFNAIRPHTKITHLKANRIAPIKTTKTKEKIQGTYDFEWFVPEDRFFQKRLVENFEPKFQSFEDHSRKLILGFEREYIREINDILKMMNPEEIMPGIMSYQHFDSLFPIINNPDYFVFRHLTYAYTGGAHGISSEDYYTYSFGLKKWLQKEDVFDMAQQAQIVRVIRNTIRAKYNIPDNMALDEPENSIFITAEPDFPDNFTLSKESVEFYYRLYELTPYAYGFFRISVPYSDLQAYMNPEFKY